MSPSTSFYNEKSKEYAPLDDGDQNQDSARQNYNSARKWILALTILTISTSLAMILLYVSKHPAGGKHWMYINSYRAQTFQQTPRNESDEAFKCLPNGNGLIYINPAVQHGLPPGLPSGDGGHNLYGIGFAHQLYCLAAIRSELHLFADNGSEIDNPEQQRQDFHNRLASIEQCIDYLRQKIMCVADITIEYPTRMDDFQSPTYISGYGIEQECAIKVSICFVLWDRYFF